MAQAHRLGFDAGEAFAAGVTRAAIHVAGADGPLNDAELSLIVRVTGRPLTAHHAVVVRRQMIDDPGAHVENMLRVLEGAVFINSLAQARLNPEGYDASADAIVHLVTELGNVVIADSDIDPAETRCLSQITGRLRQHAVAMEARRAVEASEPEAVVETVLPTPRTRFRERTRRPHDLRGGDLGAGEPPQPHGEHGRRRSGAADARGRGGCSLNGVGYGILGEALNLWPRQQPI